MNHNMTAQEFERKWANVKPEDQYLDTNNIVSIAETDYFPESYLESFKWFISKIKIIEILDSVGGISIDLSNLTMDVFMDWLKDYGIIETRINQINGVKSVKIADMRKFHVSYLVALTYDSDIFKNVVRDSTYSQNHMFCDFISKMLASPDVETPQQHQKRLWECYKVVEEFEYSLLILEKAIKKNQELVRY